MSVGGASMLRQSHGKSKEACLHHHGSQIISQQCRCVGRGNFTPRQRNGSRYEEHPIGSFGTPGRRSKDIGVTPARRTARREGYTLDVALMARPGNIDRCADHEELSCKLRERVCDLRGLGVMS
jgi:hypothetical protein